MMAGVLNGRVAIEQQGIPMLAARTFLRSHLFKRYFLIPFISATVVFVAIVYFSRSQSCSIDGFSDLIPHKKTYYAWSTKAACQKAWAMCTYYSEDSKKCKVTPNP